MPGRGWRYAMIAAAVFGGVSTVAAKPERIVSLNLCADQLVVLLADKERIASLTHLALDPNVSYVSERVADHRINHGGAEEVLVQRPDLVVAGRFTTRPTVAVLASFGIDVLDLDEPENLAGVRAQIRRLARALGEPARGESLIVEMDRRIAAVPPATAAVRPVAAVYSANGASAGRGTLIDAALNRAGYANLAALLGLSGNANLPLESVVIHEPELLVLDTAYEETPALAHQLFRHPALRTAPPAWGTVTIPSRYWVCGGPFIAEAIERLAAARP